MRTLDAIQDEINVLLAEIAERQRRVQELRDEGLQIALSARQQPRAGVIGLATRRP